MTWLPSPGNTLAFQREPGFVCVVNLNKRPITYPTDQRVLCASGPVERTTQASSSLPTRPPG